MPVQTFDSTAIKQAAYDPQTETLKIWFPQSRHPYDYFEVPQAVFDGLCRAASKGEYFNAFIKDAYRVEKAKGKRP